MVVYILYKERRKGKISCVENEFFFFFEKIYNAIVHANRREIGNSQLHMQWVRYWYVLMEVLDFFS